MNIKAKRFSPLTDSEFRAAGERSLLMKQWLLPASLLPRIGFRDNQADRVLIEPFEASFALQIPK
jgi:hypothetical protein